MTITARQRTHLIAVYGERIAQWVAEDPLATPARNAREVALWTVMAFRHNATAHYTTDNAFRAALVSCHWDERIGAGFTYIRRHVVERGGPEHMAAIGGEPPAPIRAAGRSASLSDAIQRMDYARGVSWRLDHLATGWYVDILIEEALQGHPGTGEA